MLRTALFAAMLLCVFCKEAAAETIGFATWYGNESGTRTTSGERFDERAATCALPSYRRGQPSRTVRVTVLSTGQSATCRVNDRGPAAWTGNIIDVSKGVAQQLGIVRAGRVKVRVE